MADRETIPRGYREVGDEELCKEDDIFISLNGKKHTLRGHRAVGRERGEFSEYHVPFYRKVGVPMITITYQVTQDYAVSQSQAQYGRNANNNARFAACREAVTVLEIRKEIAKFAAQSIDAEKTVRSCDEMVGKLKADIRNLQDG
jgi:hypothetical protein